MKAAFVVKQCNYPLFTRFQGRLRSLQVGAIMLGHLQLILGHCRQKDLLLVLCNILSLMSIHVNTLFDKGSSPAKLNQPLSGCPLTKLLWIDVEGWKDCAQESTVEFVRCHRADLLGREPLLRSPLHGLVMQE
jgi:hypothetical protein